MQPVAKLEGRAGIDMNFTLTDEGTRVSAKMRHNDTPFDLNTGRVVDARGAFYRSSGQSECGLLAANLEIRYFPMSRKAYENSKTSR